jgi:hypothetical protein
VNGKILLWASVSLALVGCATGYQAPGAPNFSNRVWLGESIDPPPGFLTSQQGALIGRTVNNSMGSSPLTIDFVLVDPATGAPGYAVVSNRLTSGYIVIPVSALRISPGEIWIDARDDALMSLPRVTSLAELERRFPRTIVTSQAVIPPATIVTVPPPVAVAATSLPPTPPVGPLQIARAGSVVGFPVVDSYSRPVGSVDSVAVVPSSGEVQYAIVASPAFGADSYIAVPATSAHLEGGRVVLAGSAASWMQSPRYRADQIQQALGTVGALN